MGIQVSPYSWGHIEAVQRFNARLAGTGYDEFQFPAPPPEGDSAHAYLALEDGTMRGGYILQQHTYWLGGEVCRVAHYQLPVSEGVLNRAYAGVGAQMLRSALLTQPLLFALGMGGFDRPLPRMLRAMGWKLFGVPFLFRGGAPQRVLGQIRPQGTTWARKFVLGAARATGTGFIALRLAQWGFRRRARRFEVERCSEFGSWADEIWEQARERYALLELRDRAALNARYRESRFIRLKVSARGAVAGWAVLLDTAMRGHRQFGDLRVGTIVDCLALPENASVVSRAAADELDGRGVDLTISNQSHTAWVAGLKRAGFLSGPSNYVFAASPKLAARIGHFGENHITRGDGDGPIHL